MAGTIKITALTDIGSTIPEETLFPVVDMLPSPTTMKATFSNIANVILTEAGNLYPVASVAEEANIAGTVTINAQPNITSVGTLTGLTVNGLANLGAVGNVRITGGTSGYFLRTDGSGNLTWATGGGGGGNTGNVTFDNINIIGTGNLHLQPDPANSGSYLDIFLTSGPDLHLVASAAANLILGKDDGPNVMTSWDGNVYVQSWNTGSNTQGGVWTFDGDGNLTAPGAINVGNMSIGPLPGYITAGTNTVIILNTSGSDGGFVVDYLKEDGNANTSGGELAFSSETGNATYRISLSDDMGDGFATKIWRFDGTGNLQLPDTTNIIANNIVNLVANSTGNISGLDAVGDADANLYAHANVTIVADSSNTTQTWTFGNDGTLTVPGDLIANGASPAPSLSGFSSITSLVSITTPQPLASLTATAGGRAFASDANLVAAGNFGANVSDGGSNTVPVWSDGTNWYIG